VKPRINALHQRMDAIDRALVRLLSRRAACSLAIGRKKRAEGLRLFSHVRERQIEENICKVNRGPLADDKLAGFYVALLRLTRRTVRATLRREERASARKSKGRR